MLNERLIVCLRCTHVLSSELRAADHNSQPTVLWSARVFVQHFLERRFRVLFRNFVHSISALLSHSAKNGDRFMAVLMRKSNRPIIWGLIPHLNFPSEILHFFRLFFKEHTPIGVRLLCGQILWISINLFPQTANVLTGCEALVGSKALGAFSRMRDSSVERRALNRNSYSSPRNAGHLRSAWVALEFVDLTSLHSYLVTTRCALSNRTFIRVWCEFFAWTMRHGRRHSSADSSSWPPVAHPTLWTTL